MTAGELRHQRLLALLQALAQGIQIEAGLPGLGENALGGSLFFLHVMLDQLGEHGDLGIVELDVGSLSTSSRIGALAPSCST